VGAVTVVEPSIAAVAAIAAAKPPAPIPQVTIAAPVADAHAILGTGYGSDWGGAWGSSNAVTVTVDPASIGVSAPPASALAAAGSIANIPTVELLPADDLFPGQGLYPGDGVTPGRTFTVFPTITVTAQAKGVARAFAPTLVVGRFVIISPEPARAFGVVSVPVVYGTKNPVVSVVVARAAAIAGIPRVLECVPRVFPTLEVLALDSLTMTPLDEEPVVLHVVPSECP
jgi:hypothetical protein